MVNDSIDNLRLDLSRPKVKGSLSVRYGDTKSRTVHISLANNGSVIDMRDAVFAEILIVKPDGNKCDQQMVIVGNELHYTFRTQDVNVEGECIAQIVVTYKDGAIVTSPEFSIYVYKRILDPNAQIIESQNEYNNITNILAEVIVLKEQANAYAVECQELDASATESASAAAESEANAKDSEDNAKDYSESASASASSASSSASSASLSETNASTSASLASASAKSASESEFIASKSSMQAASSAAAASLNASMALQYKNEAFATTPTGYNVVVSDVDSLKVHLASLGLTVDAQGNVIDIWESEV